MLIAGSVIAGKYRLSSPIGKGGMGAVWRATHLALGRGSRAAGPRPADGRMRWSAWQLGATAPSWESELRTGQTLPEPRRDGIAGPYTEGPHGERAFWPVRTRIARGDRTWWRWEDRTLVPDVVDAPGGGRDERVTGD